MDEDNPPDECASKRSYPEAVSNVHIFLAKIGFATVIVFLGTCFEALNEAVILTLPLYSIFYCCHGGKRSSQACFPSVQAFPQYVSGRYLTFCYSSALSFDSIKRHNHFWWRTSEFSDLTLIYQSFNSFF